jgi:DNA-binding NarL/FixJ family response regulator
VTTIRPLTPRQAKMLDMAADGLSRAEIANRLGISPATVANELHIARQKVQGERHRARRARGWSVLSAADASELRRLLAAIS